MKFVLNPFEYRFPEGDRSLFLEREISLDTPGCFLIAGPSGIGKSTFLKLLKGFYPEFLEGKIYPEINPLKNSFYLFQNPYTQLIQSSPFFEFLFSMENREFSNQDIETQLSLTKKFHLQDIIQREDTRSLSHGECQKLLFVSLIAAKPDWILLDEPTAFIDPEMRKEIYKIIQQEKKHRSFLIVDHHLEEIKNVCDGVFELRYKKESFRKDVEIIYYSSMQDFQMNKQDAAPINILSSEKERVKKNFHSAEIILKKVSPFYEKGKKLFQPIDLKIEAATVTTLIGKSGLGKSTLLKSILDEHQLADGTIEMFIDGKKTHRKKHFEHIGFLFQNPENHFFYDTVDEEIKMTGTRLEDVQHLINLFSLDSCLLKNPFFLSEGQKRRLSFLIVLLQDKKFLVLDEPTFGQDQEQVQIIIECLKISKQMGRAIVMVSHDPDFYQRVSDQVIELKGFE